MTNSPSVPGKTKHKYVLWGVLSQAFLKRTIHWSIPSLLLLIPHQMPQPNALYSYLKRHYRQNYFKSSKTALQIFYFCTELHYILPLRKLQQSSFYNISYLSDFICLEQIQQRSGSRAAKGLKAFSGTYTLQGISMKLQGRKGMGEKRISRKVLPL